MGNVLVLDIGARPNAIVTFAVVERLSDRVKARNEVAVSAEVLPHRFACAGHNVHVEDDVFGVGQLDAVFRDRRAERSHAERNNVHRAPVHTALVQTAHRRLEFLGVNPVVRRARVVFLYRRNERAVFHARHVGRKRAEKKAVRLFRKRSRKSRVHARFHQAVIFGRRSVADIHSVRLAHLDTLFNPCFDFRMLDVFNFHSKNS